ncbi:CRISPR-associated helicase Cas3' [Limosilactobacillus fastidiosus]|uniref:CRISPR-associated helicase Cas3 n=1 Tax=Limosilactobacillus fastidiosus TaxID=2759855 RepID=A0ABR6E6P0_9LACO|nr:CRISPR-associated helicase Cas3' [Limosilactobacillus fastidiosus]MBB1062859.1 CRISPR-associated helicase Cas3' [Limosilactobacillus fastidiosus]MCD7084083.1 CRISPR-associated helicase Cas3' [Limosilactobacillus fastidiosus]
MKILSNRAKSLWAKKENNDGQELWLPLVAHLMDAKNVINWLYNIWLDDSQKSVIQQNLSTDDTQKLVKFIGYFHDIGKATPAFQTKPSYNRDLQLDDELMEKLLRNGFTKLSDYRPSSRRYSPHAIAGETLLENFGLNDSIGSIIGAHHGKPAEKFFDYEDQIYDYTSNYFQSDNDTSVQNNWEKVHKELIQYGLSQSDYNQLQDVPKINQEQAVLLTGLLIMADWIASSEFLNNDLSRPMFPLIRLDQSIDDINLKQRFQNAIMTWDISGHWTPIPVINIDEHYEKRWGFKPRSVQRLMSQVIGKITDPGLIIIEAPMGIGKTEIALTAAEQLSLTSGTSGVFMGLPTQATSNAMFSRVDDWVGDLVKEENTSLPIKLMHGKAQFNQENKNLPRAENVGDQQSVVINSWFSGKKSMLADFTIGTIDHVLLMSLKQKHLFLRHLGLSGKVVIIDEIHAYDSYMNSYLKRTLQWLGAYHIPVIALSATLPKERRAALMAAYYRGKYGHKIGDGKWQDNQSYPLLTYLDGKTVHQFDEFPKTNNPHKNKIVRLDVDDDELISKVVESIENGGVAGIIVNTVKRAQKLSQLIPENIPTLTLHSSFLAPDRTKLEDKLQSNIGKNANRPDKMIVIGTQVLEQSLDIDFDVLFTDVAPMDLILQRMGRLHRHNITRPSQLSEPTTYILGIHSFGDYGDANESIYAKYLLMKTDYFLPSKIQLPTDISPLVQKVYESENDQKIAEITKPYVELKNYEKQEQRKAQVYQIEAPYPKASLHGWLDRSQQNIEDDASAEAAVRDIKESIEVVILQHASDGDYLLDGRNINDVDEDIIAQQLIRLPNAITPNISKSIDRLEQLTERYYHNWQDSIWLKGAIALPLDRHFEAKFNGWKIHYSKKLGLMYEKDEQDE